MWERGGQGSSKHSTNRDPAAAHRLQSPCPKSYTSKVANFPGPGPNQPASSLPHRGYTQPVSPEGLGCAPSSSPGKHRPKLEED